MKNRIISACIIGSLLMSIAYGQTVGSTKATGYPNGIVTGRGKSYRYTTSSIGPTAAVTARPEFSAGMATVTGSTTFTLTGITTPTYMVATLAQDASLTGNDVTTTISGTVATIKVWKPTSSSDTTPIASATAKSVSWIAGGAN